MAQLCVVTSTRIFFFNLIAPVKCDLCLALFVVCCIEPFLTLYYGVTVLTKAFFGFFNYFFFYFSFCLT